MAGKTRFQILEDILAPYDGKTLHLSKIKLLLLRGLGTSGSSVINQLRFALDAGLIQEVSHMQYRVKKLEIDGKKDV